ncbi:RicAFT regulatory complex protein RicA family protein [Allobacillus sp. GCM10007491]|uniref:RicAFT regulatory complex protein RicA family protein n=1 Tax=Allobacillus saliphilus TaxID=2912308 RepID=A0A941CS83_9BACI|nr:YlbF family regulator [Allobacillus saliphilus]MBR7552962.1 RicAFT regulatory complex protein RicA family protein [Allobacillus saliphilus]
MAEYTRKQVIEEAQELAKKLSKIEEIDRFRQLEVKINENKKVQAHIAKIKALQKQAVNLQHYDKHGALEQVEAELDRYQQELDEIPIVQEFKDSQVVVNDILQRVTKTIADEVTNEIVGESDDDSMTCGTR